MSSPSIVCRPTRDTFVRLGIILAAVLGFGLYFFYDATVGYPHKNAVYFSYQAFVDGGTKAQGMSPQEWAAECEAKPLIAAVQENGRSVVILQKDGKGVTHYLPAECEETKSTPDEFKNHAVMSKSWNDAWRSYSARVKYPLKASDKPYDVASINEQWIAGGVCLFLGAVLLYFMLRTSRRVLSIEGENICAAGQSFKLADISRIDLRQWGPGYKGVAWFTVNQKRLRVDGMTYGGFDKKNEEPAERFMKAVLAQYKGEIVEYAAEPAEPKKEKSE